MKKFNPKTYVGQFPGSSVTYGYLTGAVSDTEYDFMGSAPYNIGATASYQQTYSFTASQNDLPIMLFIAAIKELGTIQQISSDINSFFDYPGSDVTQVWPNDQNMFIATGIEIRDKRRTYMQIIVLI